MRGAAFKPGQMLCILGEDMLWFCFEECSSRRVHPRAGI